MSRQPPRKKLKQSTIFEGFRRQSSDPDKIQNTKNRGDTREEGPIEVPDGPTSDDITVIPDSQETNKELRTDTNNSSPEVSPKRGKTSFAAESHEADFEIEEDFDEDMLSEEERQEMRVKTAAAAERRLQSNKQGASSSDKDPAKPGKSDDPPSPAAADGAAAAAATSDPEPDSQQSLESTLDNSQPLFDSDLDGLMDDGSITDEALLQAADEACSWKGTPRPTLNSAPSCCAKLPALAATNRHTVLFKTPVKADQIPFPSPVLYRDSWDAEHVKLPCSPENLYPVEGKWGNKKLKKRWELIEQALKRDMTSSLDLEEAILAYNTRYAQKWDFRGLHAFFTEELSAAECQSFFKNILPKMVNLALRLPEICTQPIPLLRKGEHQSVTMTQQQAACLLANAFFCAFPRRNATQKLSEYSTYPDINFNRLFMGTKTGADPRKTEKLKCLVNYFRRVTRKMPTGTLTFTRQLLKVFPKWHQSESQLLDLHVSSTGTIEDDGIGMLQVDFANKFVGGGVLGQGCVQEEIRFLICPEMLLSRLFTEQLGPEECLIMTGCERFSNYRGYRSSFRWSGDHDDPTPRDTWGRLHCSVVAIDAIVVNKYWDQYKPQLLRREVNKAYCGFLSPGVSAEFLPAVATGNWGCGAFGGDLRLKALLQLIAAAEAKRQVCYFTFGDRQLRDDLVKIHALIKEKELQVCDLWSLIQRYDKKMPHSSRPSKNLFDFIHDVYAGYDGDTDEGSDISNEMRAEREGSQSPDYAAMTP